MTPTEMMEEMIRFSRLIEVAVDRLHDAGQEFANAEYAHTLAKDAAYREAPEGTVPERDTWVKARISKEQKRLRQAEMDRQSILEEQRSHRAQLSALQTIANAYRAEAEFVRTGPN